jgi:hypothetical protein
MNGRPKTLRALCLAANHCKHPDLDAHDKLLLTYLAQNADYITGRNSRPGNVNISDAICLKDRATDNRLANNIARGLIERTARADGRKNSSVYRICWESAFFPDRTPGGEWLIEEPRTVGCADTSDEQKEPRTLTCADSELTAHPEGVNRAPTDPKPRTTDPITAHPMVPATKVHHPHTTNPPTTTNGRWRDFFHKASAIGMGAPTTTERERLQALAEYEPHNGIDFLWGAVEFEFQNRPRGLNKLNTPWATFLRENLDVGYVDSAKARLMSSGEWRVRTELTQLLVIPLLAHHPVQANR